MNQTNRLHLEKLKAIDAPTMKKMILGATGWVKEHQSDIDALNVFPVPDGDTGTNMYLTLLDAAKEVQEVQSDDVTDIVEAMAVGSLMGARGNSGVIVSQLFRGFASGVKGKKEIGPKDLAQAFISASNKAYKAVMKPVEGTILTVARKAGEAAEKSARESQDVMEVLHAALKQAKATLSKTPEMLPVLKQANVVDAGGKGFCYILEGFIKAISGETFEPSDFQVMVREQAQEARVEEALEYVYCTEFLLKGKDLKIDQIRSDLAEYGDSLLVVGSSDVTKVHIHTNNPGQVLDYAGQHGRMSKIKIDNMEEQAETKANNEMAMVNDSSLEADQLEKDFGIVAVVAGNGLAEIYSSMGVDQLVTGGQSMNPSTQDLVDACNAIPSDTILILPNNKNVVFAAQQVKEVCDKNIHVVPTLSIPQGIAALMHVNPEMDFEEMYEEMVEGIEDVKTGEVTFAVRDSKVNSLDIKEGDIIGLYNGEIKLCNNEINKVAVELLEIMIGDGDYLITIYRGQDASSADGLELQNIIENAFADCDVELYDGGQPLYYYIFSVE